LSYNLYWDNGSGIVNIELCDSLVNQFTVTGLVGGTDYSFMIRAKNIYGYGEFSEVYLIEASDLPGKPIIPTVGLEQTNVVIVWQAPYSHYSAIDAYEIVFMRLDGSFIAINSTCDGS
jgi:hypothetical protein